MPKKKFIDKKKAVTFHLVHRSQRDPLQADETAPKHVLLPTKEKEQRKEEQLKFGIYFDDDYDYLQHLKDSNELQDVGPVEAFRIVAKPETTAEKAKTVPVNLPSTAFGTNYETDVGLLNKAAPLRGPQLDWDPDIVAALDDDFDFEDPNNVLEDDFLAIANDDTVPTSSQYPEGNDDDNDGYYPSDEADLSDDDVDQVSDVGSLGEQTFRTAETKSRFTNYSMSSSVIRRNAGLTLLDDRFEHMFAEYDDTEIGALEQEEIKGYVKDDNPLLNAAVEEWLKLQEKVTLKDVVDKCDDVDVVSGEESSSASETELIEVDSKPKWDCQTILSTYSNLYNRPTLICEPSKRDQPIQLTKRIGIPDDVLPQRGLTLKQLEREERQQRQLNTAPTLRPKGETNEEKRARKQAVKEQRRERRQEKKMNKVAFKGEELRQHKELINLNKNLKGIKIV